MLKKNYTRKFACFCIFMPVFIILMAVNAHSGDIGFVDMNRILVESQDAMDVRDLLKLEEERYEIRFEKKKGLLKSKIDSALQGRQKADDYKEYQMELDEIRDDRQHMGNLIEFREIELTHGLFKKIMDAVKNAANKKGYKYVFELTESRIFFQDNTDDITDDVIAEMDKTHYEARLLEDLKTKKGIYLRPDVKVMRQRELTEMERMIASLEKRHKETKPVPEGLNRGKEIAVKEDKKDEKDKKDKKKSALPLKIEAQPAKEEKTMEDVGLIAAASSEIKTSEEKTEKPSEPLKDEIKAPSNVSSVPPQAKEIKKAKKILAIEAVKNEKDLTQIMVLADGNIESYKAFEDDSSKLVVDIFAVGTGIAVEKIDVGGSHIKNVRIGKYKDKTRLVFDSISKNLPLYSIDIKGEAMLVSFGKGEKESALPLKTEPSASKKVLDDDKSLLEKKEGKTPAWEMEMAVEEKGKKDNIEKKADEKQKKPPKDKSDDERELVKGGVSAKVLIKSKLLAQPVYNSNVLDVIDADGEVTIIKSLANYWYYVQAFDGKKGYLFAAAFDRFVTGHETVFIKGVKVSIRDEAYSKIFGYISNGHALLLEGEGGEIVKIAAPCCTGYVAKKYVKKKE